HIPLQIDKKILDDLMLSSLPARVVTKTGFLYTSDRPPSPNGKLMSGYNLTHLKQLEAESIHVIREVASEFENPVMLYSIGKDSAVILHLALKAFHPAKPPFPLLHVNTTWKFRDMIAFRDRRASELGVRLIGHVNQEGLARGIDPISHPDLHTDVMKTQGL